MTSPFKSSLFWRLSGGLLLMLLVLGVAYVSITVTSARKYYQETTQKLHAHVARHMLLEVNPFQNGEVNEEALGKIMHSMMAVNPALEVYLLDAEGTILKYVVLDEEVRLKNVDIAPVKRFIAEKGQSFVLGDDPRTPGAKTIFSATEVHEQGRFMGYVYMVLASEKSQNIAEALQGSYFLKIGTRAFWITLVAAFALGLLLIALLTKKLRKIISGVKQFEEGDYHLRIPDKGKGELNALARTFNHMADTILQNMEDLKEVDSLRRDLIANVSHDLRSPLAVIHGYVETLLIKNDRLSKDQRKQYLEIVLKNSDRLSKQVSDLFELSKLEARQVEVLKEAFNLKELLKDTAQQYQGLAKEKGIQLQTDLPENALVKADIALVQRALQNLLDNALKFSSGGKVKLLLKQQEEKWLVAISNTGKPIASEKLNKVFDRYYKDADRSTDSTGLGLAIVKNIMDIHESKIWAESTPQGLTTFCFTLQAA